MVPNMPESFESYRLLIMKTLDDIKEELRLARAERTQNRTDIVQMKVWVTLVAGLVSGAVTALFMALIELVLK